MGYENEQYDLNLIIPKSIALRPPTRLNPKDIAFF
jgi:hypothetical protein